MSKFKAAPLFTDNMVLQRGKNINIFGTGEDGTVVTVSFCGLEASCTVTNGKWGVVFPPMGACRHMMMTLDDGDPEDAMFLENVAVGEVWLAGGQSNMQFELAESTGGKEALENDDVKDVRFFNMPRKTCYNDDYEESIEAAEWTDFSDKEAAAHWSAAAYFCAKEMSQYLDVTVGIVNCNWGGTTATCWMDREHAIGEAAVYFEEYDAYMAGTTPEKAIAEYREWEKEYAVWSKKRDEYFSSNENPTDTGCEEVCGPKPPSPKAPCNPKAPGLLYENLVKRIAPYTLGGVLWYQGENDEAHPEAYYTALTNLIRNWRDLWRDDQLTFIIGQLPVYGGKDPDGDSWAIIRAAQMRVYNTIKNTGIVVLLDCGERDNLHPFDKRQVGHRFAMQAMDIVYGGCDGAYSPTIKNAIWRGDMVELQFDNARGGFRVKGSAEGFEICGEDGVFVPAIADVSEERIFLTAPNIEHPCGVRYLCKNYDEIHFFNGFGLPLAPFHINNVR